MANIKMGALTQDVRGSLNGMVFSRNPSGAYIRSKVSPIQPVSDFSSRSRAIFKALSQRWASTITDTQRVAWIAWAALHPITNVFGDSLIMSGIAAYQAVNRRLGEIGADYIDDPPATFAVDDIGAVTVAFTTTAPALTTMSVSCARSLGGDESLYIFATEFLAPGRLVQKNQYRLVNSPTTGGFSSGASLVTPYTVRFPGLTYDVGLRVAYLVAAINEVTGALSTAVAVQKVSA